MPGLHRLLLVAVALLTVQPSVTAWNAFHTEDARQRAQQLLDQMTWKEKIGQMGGIRQILPRGVEFNQTFFDDLYELQNGNIGQSPKLDTQLRNKF